MNDKMVALATKAIYEVLQEANLAPAETIIALSSVAVIVLDQHLEAAQNAGGDNFLRTMRRTLHVLPDSITQFLHAWQPGRKKEAVQATARLINEKFDQAMNEADQLSRQHTLSTKLKEN